ncbi:hypothetical protein, partial [Burkholderia mallei]|uniref:hypothetical protein n=1 Tax=Burkholderia mallei TaxID=13373 RepID=UPI001E4A92D5
LRHEFLERHHLEFVLRGHGRLQHHAIKKQKTPTWRGFVSNLGQSREGLPVFRLGTRRTKGRSRARRRPDHGGLRRVVTGRPPWRPSAWTGDDR